MKATILFLGNNKLEEETRSLLFKNHDFIETFSKDEAITSHKLYPVDLIMLEINIDDINFSKEIMEDFIKIDMNVPILIFSEEIDSDSLIELFRTGASDFIFKPMNIKILSNSIDRLYEKKRKNIRKNIKKNIEENEEITIIGRTKEILRAKSKIVEASHMRILLIGETGVGKTPFARYANFIAGRENNNPRPFEQINCAGLKRERFIDDLFGHVKGAYTGAHSEKKGLVELAEGGDLFLDEVGELNMDSQCELLSFLDEGEYFRLGGTKKLKALVRIISATNHDLNELIDKGLFRKDLYSRLSENVIRIPPLRERKSDIKLFMRHFIYECLGHIKPYEAELENLFTSLHWKEGNVRELKNACAYLCLAAREDETIKVAHIEEYLKQKNPTGYFVESLDKIYSLGFNKFFSELEKKVLKETIKPTLSLRKNAKILKMNRHTLTKKITEHEIPMTFY